MNDGAASVVVSPTLDELVKENPDLPKCFPERIWVELSRPPDSVFPDDLAFLRACNAVFEVRFQFLEIEKQVRRAFAEPVTNHYFPIEKDAVKAIALLAAVQKLIDFAQQLIRA